MASTDTSEGEEASNSDSVGRVIEEVAASKSELGDQIPRVQVSIRPRTGGATQVTWLADSGVHRTLLSEADWAQVKAANPATKLKKNKISFRPYGTKLFLPILGRLKVVLGCTAGKQIRTMAFGYELCEIRAEMFGIISSWQISSFCSNNPYFR